MVIRASSLLGLSSPATVELLAGWGELRSGTNYHLSQCAFSGSDTLTTTLSFLVRLAPCATCGQLHATSVRDRFLVEDSRLPLALKDSATDTAWGDVDCRDCRQRRLLRDRVRRHRERTKQPLQQVACQHCSNTFTPQRSTARFCSTACRVAHHRNVTLNK
jgi:hypothetical protein